MVSRVAGQSSHLSDSTLVTIRCTQSIHILRHHINPNSSPKGHNDPLTSLDCYVESRTSQPYLFAKETGRLTHS